MYIYTSSFKKSIDARLPFSKLFTEKSLHRFANMETLIVLLLETTSASRCTFIPSLFLFFFLIVTICFLINFKSQKHLTLLFLLSKRRQ